ncbi:MAG: AsmA family protein [Mariprofundaceae bacterium]|nr:AsmA family protein [Mariprofundaceae bacterium]
MMRGLKYFSIAVVLLLGGLLIAPFIIDVDQYRIKIEQQVEDSTGRALHIGKMQASLFPWIGLKLEDVNFANADGFSAPFFLKVGRLDVQLAFLPLLQQKIELKRFELNAPEIHLQRNKDGIGNWQDLQGDVSLPPKDEAKGESTKSGSLPFAFEAESILLNDGRIAWDDASTGQNITLKNIQLALHDVQQERPINVQASVNIGDDTITLQGKVGPVGDIDRLVVERIPVQLQLSSSHLALTNFAAIFPDFPDLLGSKEQASVLMNIQVEQRPDGLRTSDGSFTLKAAHEISLQWIVEQIDAQHLQLKSSNMSLDGQSLLHAKGNITLEKEGSPTVAMQINSEVITRKWLSTWLPALVAMYADHPNPWKQMDIALALKVSDGIINLQNMKVHLDQDLLKLSGRYVMGKNPNIRLRLHADQLHLDPWLPFSSSANNENDAPAVKEVSPTSEPDLRAYAKWKINLQSSIGQLHVKNAVFNDVALNVQSSQGMININPLSFVIAGGKVREKARININNHPITWRESVSVKGVNIGPLLQRFADSDQLDGRLQLTTNFQGKGVLPTSIKRALNGSAKVKMTNGKVKGFDIAHALRNISTLGKKKGAQYTDFAQLQASFTVRDGIVSNNDLFMASPLFRLTGKGTVNLPTSTMDYHMRPKLVATLVGQGDQANGRTGITIPLRIVGPFDSPSISPELDAASFINGVKNAFKGNGTGVANTLKDAASKAPLKAAKDKVNKALGGLIPSF